MKLTIKQTLSAIRLLPGVKARYQSEYKEFCVLVIGRPDASYFTDDAEDALKTAKCMSDDSLRWYKAETDLIGRLLS